MQFLSNFLDTVFILAPLDGTALIRLIRYEDLKNFCRRYFYGIRNFYERNI